MAGVGGRAAWVFVATFGGGLLPGDRLARRLHAPAPAPRRVAFDASGQRAVVSAWGAPLELLEPPLPRLEQLDEPESPSPLAIDDDGALLVYGRDRGLERHTDGGRTRERLLAPLPGWLWNAAILPRRRLLLLGRNDDDVTMRPWDGGPAGLRPRARRSAALRPARGGLCVAPA